MKFNFILYTLTYIYMSEKSLLILYSKLQYEMDQDFLDSKCTRTSKCTRKIEQDFLDLTVSSLKLEHKGID